MKTPPPGIPYVEARRIRYLTIICDILLSRGASDIELIIDLLLVKTKKLNENLTVHVRTTGILRSHAVAKGYIEFSKWLGWIDFDGPVLLPNGYTAYISSMSGKTKFSLDHNEKLGILMNIIEKDAVRAILKELKETNRISELRTTRTSEHFIESVFDLFVDLGVLLPSQKSYGFFHLSHTGSALVKTCDESPDPMPLIQSYAASLIEREVRIVNKLGEKVLYRILVEALDALSTYTRSQWDPKLHSALPVLLYIRLKAITEELALLSMDDLIENMKILSSRLDFQFKWEELSQRGYIRLEGK